MQINRVMDELMCDIHSVLPLSIETFIVFVLKVSNMFWIWFEFDSNLISIWYENMLLITQDRLIPSMFYVWILHFCLKCTILCVYSKIDCALFCVHRYEMGEVNLFYFGQKVHVTRAVTR